MKLSQKLLTLTLGLAITSQTFASNSSPCFKEYYSKVAVLDQEITHYEQTYKYYTGRDIQNKDGTSLHNAAGLFVPGVAGCLVGMGLAGFSLLSMGLTLPIGIALCGGSMFLPLVPYIAKDEAPVVEAPVQTFNEDRQKKIDEITLLFRERLALKHDYMMVASWIGLRNVNDHFPSLKYKNKMLEAIKDSPKIGINTPSIDYISVLLKPFIKSGAACANNSLMSADEFKNNILEIITTDSLEKAVPGSGSLKLEYSLPNNEITGNEAADTKKCADGLLNAKVLKDKNFPRMHNLTVTSSRMVNGKIYNYLKFSLVDKQKQTYSGWMYLGKEGASCNTFLNWGAATRAIKIIHDSSRGIVYKDDCAYDYKNYRSQSERCERL